MVGIDRGGRKDDTQAEARENEFSRQADRVYAAASVLTSVAFSPDGKTLAGIGQSRRCCSCIVDGNAPPRRLSGLAAEHTLAGVSKTDRVDGREGDKREA